MKDFFFFKQKTAYEMRISDWSSDVCSSDLHPQPLFAERTLALLQLLEIADHPAVITRQRDHEQQFGDEPALASIIAVEGEHQPEYPDDDQRRIQDDPTQPVLALTPFPFLVGPHGTMLSAVSQSRYDEYAGHQKAYENKMTAF